MTPIVPSRRTLAAAAALAALIAAPLARAETVFGLTGTNQLFRFDSATPTGASAPVSIFGLQPSEQILGIDIRPATGALVGLSSSGRLYALDATSGAATLISTLNAALSGASFGVDFNPTVDRLRVTSDAGQNLRINVDTGGVTVDAALNGAVAALDASAYTNSFAGAATTTLYGISSATDGLYIQNPPNNGTLSFIGALGVDSSALAGFDIGGASGIAYASLTNGTTGKSSFYTINLATGAATLVGAFGWAGNMAGAPPVLDIAVAAVPEPGTYALMLAGLLGVGVIARRRAARD